MRFANNITPGKCIHGLDKRSQSSVCKIGCKRQTKQGCPCLLFQVHVAGKKFPSTPAENNLTFQTGSKRDWAQCITARSCRKSQPAETRKCYGALHKGNVIYRNTRDWVLALGFGNQLSKVLRSAIKCSRSLWLNALEAVDAARSWFAARSNEAELQRALTLITVTAGFRNG